MAERDIWSSKIDSFLSQLSYAVGLGNIWRFPYICSRNGGGAFLVAYITMMFIIGIPLVFLEMAFGQYGRAGVVSIWSVSPLFEGVGWAMFVVSTLVAIYYNMIIAWTLYFLFASFAKQLPWKTCGALTTEGCFEDRSVITKCTRFDGVWFNSSCVVNGSVITEWTFETHNSSNRTAFENNFTNADYFTSNVLDITKGIDDMGTMHWKSALCLLLAWILVSMCMAKGIKTSGKAMYFMAIFPYIALTILLIRGLTLDGSVDGIAYFFLPDWNQLLYTKVWCDAAVQIFYSLSPCTGGLITLSSYNKFKNNCLLDAILISIIDSVTSIFSGLVVFTVLGYMAQELQVDIKDVTTQGAGLAFVVYPEVITKLPISQLWAVIFFAMLASVGLGSQIANVTTIQTTLKDKFPRLFHTGPRSLMLLGLVAVFCYLIGLVFCFRGGMYVLQLFDNYAASYSVLFIGLVECVALSWIYGTDRILDNMESMLGRRPSKIWTISWKYLAPIGLAGILIFSCANFVPTKYGDYIFPAWAEVIGLLLTLSSVMAVLGVAVFKVFKMKRTNSASLLKCMKHLVKPLPKWDSVCRESTTDGADMESNLAGCSVQLTASLHNIHDIPMSTSVTPKTS